MAKKKEDTKAKSKPKKSATPAAVKATNVTDKKVTKSASSVAKKPQDTKQVLQRWNLVGGIVLALQAVAIALLGKGDSVPVVMHYPAVDTLASEAAGSQVIGAASRTLFDMPIAYLLAAGLLAMAIVHLLAATQLRLRFESMLDRGVNVARWIAYGVGGVLLLDAVYLLSGINDVVALKMLGSVLFGACLVALSVELLGPGRPGLSRLLKVMTVVGVVLPWLVIAGVLVASMMYDGTVPSYMYGVYASGFILFVAIVLATSFRWQQRGRWANQLYSEKMFLLLGLATATVLSWQIFAGALL